MQYVELICNPNEQGCEKEVASQLELLLLESVTRVRYLYLIPGKPRLPLTTTTDRGCRTETVHACTSGSSGYLTFCGAACEKHITVLYHSHALAAANTARILPKII